MARKTLKRRNSRGSRKTRGARRMRGGSLALSPADFNAGAEGGAQVELNEFQQEPAVNAEVQSGGKRRKGRKGSRKGSKKVGKTGKRKTNAFFKLMMNAKKSDAPSFSYNGKTYKKRTKGHLVYYKA